MHAKHILSPTLVYSLLPSRFQPFFAAKGRRLAERQLYDDDVGYDTVDHTRLGNNRVRPSSAAKHVAFA